MHINTNKCSNLDTKFKQHTLKRYGSSNFQNKESIYNKRRSKDYVTELFDFHGEWS